MKPTKYRIVAVPCWRGHKLYRAQRRVLWMWWDLGTESRYYTTLEEATADINRHKNKEHLPHVIWEDK